MYLVVGLGNPGSKYEHNRHNVGFHIIDALAEKYNAPSFRAKFQGFLSEISINNQKLILLKPTTFMNNSGQSVVEAKKFYKLKPEEIIVIHDEIDLPFKKVRVKIGGGHGGHNGLRDIDNHIGKNYKRLRFGVNHPGHKDLVHRHVLGDFSKDEKKDLGMIFETVADGFHYIIDNEDEKFMSHIAWVTQK